MPCGPLDQFASVFGKRDHALMMDCRSLTADVIPLPANTAFVLIDSGVKHRLVDGGYEQRRRECEQAAAQLGLNALRDASAHDLERVEPPLRQRALHVVTENERVMQTAAALRAADIVTAGALMAQSHKSLRDDFAVTCAETDALAEIANATRGVFGARQMGGGFGGCVIALVDATHARDAAAHPESMHQRFGAYGHLTALSRAIYFGAREPIPLPGESMVAAEIMSEPELYEQVELITELGDDDVGELSDSEWQILTADIGEVASESS
jgi:galactokinase